MNYSEHYEHGLIVITHINGEEIVYINIAKYRRGIINGVSIYLYY